MVKIKIKYKYVELLGYFVGLGLLVITARVIYILLVG